MSNKLIPIFYQNLIEEDLKVLEDKEYKNSFVCTPIQNEECSLFTFYKSISSPFIRKDE